MTTGAGETAETSSTDNTQYKNIVFHTIPSLYQHISPTDEEIAAAKANKVTPSLPIDMVRYVEFVTPRGNIARIHYPDFFSIEGSDIASARNWIREQAMGEWQAIIDREQATTLSEKDTRANIYLAAGVLPTNPIDWNIYISDEMITRILQAKNWLHPDISKKYKQAIDAMLSYSHGASGSLSPSTIPPQIPSLSEEYEIAYLGLPSSFGADFNNAGYSRSMEDYHIRIREIEGANISDEDVHDGVSESNNPATECGPPDGVPLAQWPGAIMCWIRAQFPPRILAGSCGPSTIGLESPSSQSPISPGQSIVTDTGALTQFYSGSQIIPHLPRSSMGLRESISIDLRIIKNNTPLGILPGTEAHMEIISGTI